MTESKKYVIVGGVAGGATVAARLRRLDENAGIVVFERGEYISFANCGLPYHIGGVIKRRENLLVQTAEGMRDRYNLDIRVESEVLSIDREAKTVSVKNLKTGRIYEETYDVLVLSPGAAPVRPRIQGIDSQRVYTLRNMGDMDRILRALGDLDEVNAVVVGGGFIGLEMAENLHARGSSVTIVEMAEQVMTNLDREMASMVHMHIREKGVGLVLSDAVSSFSEHDTHITVNLKSGGEIIAHVVVVAIGVRPESSLARDSGLAIGPRGGILVGPQFSTSDPSIFAIGDAAEFDLGRGKTSWVPLAGPANRQARLLADHLHGRKVSYKGAQGTAIARIFDLVVATTGKSERSARQEGTHVLTSITHSNSNAAYYPGASTVSIKLVFTSDEGKVIGAQVIGRQGVDKRIDVLSTAVRFGATVEDLASLELAYAPPFGSAKDPVNIAGYVAQNIWAKEMEVAHWHEVLSSSNDTVTLIDVREPGEWDAGHIEGAMNIPLHSLRKRLAEIPREKDVVVYCRVGQRAWYASRILAQNGFKVRNLAGGWLTYFAVAQDLEATGGTNGPANGPREQGEEAATITAGETPTRQQAVVKLDATGMQCPGPIVSVYKAMSQLEAGDILEVTASDPGFLHDIGAWCGSTGNTLLYAGSEGNLIRARIEKATSCPVTGQDRAGNDKTIVVFSSDLDKALATFVIANGARAMGRKVTLFFTFWGLNVLRRQDPPGVKKGLLDRMFGFMMPRGSKALGLSRMNMGGMGALMIRNVMNQKGVASLEDAIAQARALGVRLVACQMSMDVMGLKPEELIEGVEIGGVASYLAAAETADVNLFI